MLIVETWHPALTRLEQRANRLERRRDLVAGDDVPVLRVAGGRALSRARGAHGDAPSEAQPPRRRRSLRRAPGDPHGLVPSYGNPF